MWLAHMGKTESLKVVQEDSGSTLQLREIVETSTAAWGGDVWVFRGI